MSAETIVKKLFTVDEYHRMWDAGILPEDKRFELIRGEIIEMATAKPPHSGRVNRVNSLFTSRLGNSVIVGIQNPAWLDEMSEPVPDVTLLKPRADFYSETNPTPDDVLLLIEVSHTTLRYDTKRKAPLYAEAGIQEYWILNIPNTTLEIRRNPVDGTYQHHEVLHKGQSISPLAFPSLVLQVEDILG